MESRLFFPWYFPMMIPHSYALVTRFFFCASIDEATLLFEQRKKREQKIMANLYQHIIAIQCVCCVCRQNRNFSSNWSEVCMNVQFQQFRMFKVCAKNTENQKSRDKQNNNNNQTQINKWCHQIQNMNKKNEHKKCNKRTHAFKQW